MLRYFSGELIKDGDICTSISPRTLIRLYYVITDGTILRYKDLLSTDAKEVRKRDFISLKSGKGKKHKLFELLIRKEDWQKIITKLADKASKIDLTMNYTLPEGILEAWTGGNRAKKK